MFILQFFFVIFLFVIFANGVSDLIGKTATKEEIERSRPSGPVVEWILIIGIPCFIYTIFYC